MGQYLLGDFPGIPLGEMVPPTADRLLDLSERAFSTSVLSTETFELLMRSFYIVLAETNSIGIDAKSEKVCAVVSFGELAFDGVDLESEKVEIGFDRGAGMDEMFTVVAEEGKVIDVADVV